MNGRAIVHEEKPITDNSPYTISDMVRKGKNTVSVRWLPRQAASAREAVEVQVDMRVVDNRTHSTANPTLVKQKAALDPAKPREQQVTTWEFSIEDYPIDDLPWLKNADRKFSDADRDAVVVAHGGGVFSDIAGFAASMLLRGVRWVSVLAARGDARPLR